MNSTFLVTIILALVASAFAARVTYLDLPGVQLSGSWVAGMTVRPVICWNGVIRKPYRMDSGEQEWTLLIKHPIRRNKPVTVTKWTSYEAYNDVLTAGLDESLVARVKKSAKYQLLVAKKNDIPKCWVAEFKIPDDIKSSMVYRLQLTRKGGLFGRRRYNKSPMFSVIGTETPKNKQFWRS